MDSLYNGGEDVFLVKVRADFDAAEDQGLTSMKALEKSTLIGSEPMADSLFVKVAAATEEGMRAVWRHIAVSGAKALGKRKAGGQFDESDFLRLYETQVVDPDNQTAGKFSIPEEREAKEGKAYKSMLNRAKKLMDKASREIIRDPFEVFNLAFTAPASYPDVKFFARGNRGLDDNATALGERLVSTQHVRADAGTTQSNASTTGGNAQAFSDASYYAAKELGFTFKDDVGDDAPRFTGKVTLVANNYGSILRTAKEINKSEWVTASNQNQINVNMGTILSMKSHPGLAASSYAPSTIANPSQWFIVDEDNRDTEVGTGLVCVEFVPQQSKVYRENGTDSIVYNLKQEYSYGFTEWRNTIGSPGTGAYSS